MHIETHSTCDEDIIQISGDMRGQDAGDLLQQVRACTRPRVVIDLRDLSFIDSHGLGGLIFSQKVLERTRRQLVIISPSDDLRALLHDYSLDRTLVMVDGETAMAA